MKSGIVNSFIRKLFEHAGSSSAIDQLYETIKIMCPNHLCAPIRTKTNPLSPSSSFLLLPPGNYDDAVFPHSISSRCSPTPSCPPSIPTISSSPTPSSPSQEFQRRNRAGDDEEEEQYYILQDLRIQLISIKFN